MEESDSLTAQLNANAILIVQLFSQGMAIKEELCAVIMMSSSPQSLETFVTTVCNASRTAMT